jgi:hypothetical protein
MRELQRVILGNLPLLGISYQGEQKDRDYREKFSKKHEMKQVMKVAIQHGVTFFASSSHDFNHLSPLYLQALKEVENEEEERMHLITCIGVPLEFKGRKINDYRRWTTHLQYESKGFGIAVRERYLNDPLLNFRSMWRENLTQAKPYDRDELDRELRIDWDQWENRLHTFSAYKIAWVEPGSETDFLALCRIDLLGELIDKIHETGHDVLLASHHFGASAPLIQKKQVRGFDGYVTPVNKLGVMMFPTQREVENAITMTRKEGKLIIGIKPFAGGRIPPREALEYAYIIMKVDSCMLGVGSVEEAEEDLNIAKQM